MHNIVYLIPCCFFTGNFLFSVTPVPRVGTIFKPKSRGFGPIRVDKNVNLNRPNLPNKEIPEEIPIIESKENLIIRLKTIEDINKFFDSFYVRPLSFKDKSPSDGQVLRSFILRNIYEQSLLLNDVRRDIKGNLASVPIPSNLVIEDILYLQQKVNNGINSCNLRRRFLAMHQAPLENHLRALKERKNRLEQESARDKANIIIQDKIANSLRNAIIVLAPNYFSKLGLEELSIQDMELILDKLNNDSFKEPINLEIDTPKL